MNTGDRPSGMAGVAGGTAAPSESGLVFLQGVDLTSKAVWPNMKICGPLSIINPSTTETAKIGNITLNPGGTLNLGVGSEITLGND